jgi:rRNA maturation protein Nop10
VDSTNDAAAHASPIRLSANDVSHEWQSDHGGNLALIVPMGEGLSSVLIMQLLGTEDADRFGLACINSRTSATNAIRSALRAWTKEQEQHIYRCEQCGEVFSRDKKPRFILCDKHRAQRSRLQRAAAARRYHRKMYPNVQRDEAS